MQVSQLVESQKGHGAKVIVLCAVLCIAAMAPWVILFGVNYAMGTPVVEYRSDECTRDCHNRGCRHDPLLPDFFTSNRGLFGRAVMALHAMGDSSGLGRCRGYGAANLVVFCVIWPGLMLLLVGVVTWQRLELRAASRSNDG